MAGYPVMVVGGETQYGCCWGLPGQSSFELEELQADYDSLDFYL